MRALAALILLLTAACTDASTTAQRPEPSHSLDVHDAWAAPTPGGVDVSAGYLTISNHTAAADTLVSVSSARAERVEVHEMTMADGVMRMRPAASLLIPADGEIALAPGGMHLMFYGVTQAFAQGESIPVQLTFANAGQVDVSLPVQRGASAPH